MVISENCLVGIYSGYCSKNDLAREKLSMLIRALRNGFGCLALIGLVCVLGCGPASVRTEPVSGSVTVKGQPAKNVEIYFVNEKLVAMGKTDDAGKFQLVQGAVAGENKVYFKEAAAAGGSKFAGQEGIDDYQAQMAAGSGSTKPTTPKSVLPPEYTNAVEPKLNFVVPSGGTTTADFKL